MKVIEITLFGGPDVLRLGERAAPVPAVGEVLIRVAASGVNRPDVLQRMGHYPVPAVPRIFLASKWRARSSAVTLPRWLVPVSN